MTISPGRRRFLQGSLASATLVGTSGTTMALTVAAGDRPMPDHELGITGVKLPILQLGTSQDLDPTYDKVMHRCYKEGVTALDTALSYGWGASHRAIANFLRQIDDRAKLWITSKSGKDSTKGLSKDLDRALAELHTDYLDLYLMHGINDTDMLEPEYLKTGERLRNSGKTRFFGFSCHGGQVVPLMNKAAKVGGIDAILFRYNFRRYGDRDLNLAIDNCKKAGIGLLAMKTQGSVPKDIEAVAEFRSQDFTLGQAKLKSVWADERIDAIVSEMDNVRVARENIAAAKSEKSLSAGDLHQLNRLAAMTASYACNGCSHFCESAIAGQTAIADQLRYLMYYESYGKQDSARELFLALPDSARRFDEGELRHATAVCPQGIDIAARVSRAHELLSA